MISLSCVLLLVAAFATAAVHQFRSDYVYRAHAEGWFKFHKTPSMWWMAELQCLYEGGILASPLNEDIKDVMTSLVRENKAISRFGVHTGIHNRHINGQYSSVDGVPLSEMPVQYEGLFPDEYALAAYCMHMFSQGDLMAGNCSDTLPYICYRNKTRADKLTECGTVDTGYHLSKETGQCYKFHNYAMKWSLAYMACGAEGGHLAIINSDKEAMVLKDLFAKFPSDSIKGAVFNDGAHIGFLDWYHRGTWRTIHGQSLQSAGYATWSRGEPNNQFYKNQYQYCGSMFRTGLLDDTYCDLPLAFICEKDPDSLRA